ncbi:26S proteasome non-ATPase regulatory subunit 10 isoform X1 [Onychostruthus taczanowskii]|uniref:26S proteasome non-ATPase regulatory subunit 10 isoform X1 n=1 Tax=Onychostruthus taczanowskii TaxID=356909 RepID=UPI001B8014B3|nr:26S proteasome non-ATPase regulatory subunit 10 isoform X1 [Onychostruthus taczanowskii]
MEGAVSDVAVCNLAFAGRLEELRALLLRDRAQATRADQDHRTALHWACSAGHTDVADLLLGLGVPVNDKDDAGWTPLHIAASAGRDEIVKALIAKGAHVNAVNQNGCTPLHYAASKNKQEIAIMLLENGADPDATDHFESTPLHRAAAKGNLKMVQILVQHNATLDIRDSEGNTPLLLCASTISTSLLFLPARMATTGNIFSIVAHIFLMLGEKRDQMLLNVSIETELVYFLKLVFCFPYQLCINTS